MAFSSSKAHPSNRPIRPNMSRGEQTSSVLTHSNLLFSTSQRLCNSPPLQDACSYFPVGQGHVFMWVMCQLDSHTRRASTHRRRRAGRWSCCGKEDPAATGCTPQPHRPKEIMISVRAEGGPPVLVGNTEVCRDVLSHNTP